MSLEHIPTSQLREAALAWRNADRGTFMFPRSVNVSLYEKIDDMIAEIERLRNLLEERK